jgi:hypothetical protein
MLVVGGLISPRIRQTKERANESKPLITMYSLDKATTAKDLKNDRQCVHELMVAAGRDGWFSYCIII